MSLLSGENLLLASSVLLIVGVLVGKTSYRTGLPLLLVFLLVGMLFGTDGLGIQFSDMHYAQNVGMIALCIILFSGGMSTRISSIRPIIAPGIMLSTLGVLVTALLTGLFIFWLSGMSWTNIHFALLPSLLLASAMSSTDSASVFGILGSQRVTLRHNLRPMLELESGSNDPMAYMLTIILIEAITLDGELSAGMLAVQLLLQFGVGGALGVGIGLLTRKLAGFYRRIGNPATEDAGQATAMLSIMIIGAVFLTYTLTTALQGNGYLAVYICGIVLGNTSLPYRRSIAKFMDGMTWLAQIVVFLMLGLLVNPRDMLSVAAVSTLIGIFMIVIGRPLSVWLCLLPFRKITMRTKTFVSWVGLRGAVPIIFATYPVVADVPGASQIFNIVFFVTILSLLVQGTTVMKAAGLLGLIDKNAAPSEHDFGVELADEHPTSLHTLVLTEEHLEHGDTLSRLTLPEGSLVMMIHRDDRYIVPNGRVKLRAGDKLLLISDK